MSYCRRNSDSDVYVIKDCDNRLICFCGRNYFSCKSELTMIIHLVFHYLKLDKVSFKAINRLYREYFERKFR